MRISNRLQALYDAVSSGESVADIGTDHGYVPLMLLQNGISDKVILSDISSGSLAKAIENVKDSGVEIPSECFRIGDGLSTVGFAEVDDVIIGGLGGRTIQMILEENLEKTRSYKKLILQPRNNSGELRCFLYCNGYDIQQEILAEEGKFVCEIIVAVTSSEKRRPAPYDEHDIRWKYPEQMISCDSKLLSQRIQWRAGRILEQVESLRRSQGNQEERIQSLLEAREYILGLEQRNKKYHAEKTECY